MEHDHGDNFSFDFEPNGILFSSKLDRKLSPRSYSIQFERKGKSIFVSVTSIAMLRFSSVSHPLLFRFSASLPFLFHSTSTLPLLFRFFSASFPLLFHFSSTPLPLLFRSSSAPPYNIAVRCDGFQLEP